MRSTNVNNLTKIFSNAHLYIQEGNYRGGQLQKMSVIALWSSITEITVLTSVRLVSNTVETEYNSPLSTCGDNTLTLFYTAGGKNYPQPLNKPFPVEKVKNYQI